MFKRLITATAFLTALGAASTALAHAHLVAQQPAADSAVSAPPVLRLSFSEGVEPAFSTVSLTREGAVVAVQAVALDPANPKQLIVTPQQPLTTGRYEVKWHVVSVDTHKSEGHYAFEVTP